MRLNDLSKAAQVVCGSDSFLYFIVICKPLCYTANRFSSCLLICISYWDLLPRNKIMTTQLWGILMPFTVVITPEKYWAVSFSDSSPSQFCPCGLQHSGGTPIYPSHILPGSETYWCKWDSAFFLLASVILILPNRSQWSFVAKKEKINLIYNRTFTKIGRLITLRTKSSFESLFGRHKTKNFRKVMYAERLLNSGKLCKVNLPHSLLSHARGKVIDKVRKD